MCVYVYVCVCIRVCIYHAFLLECVCMHVRTHACVHACICVRACVRFCLLALGRVYKYNDSEREDFFRIGCHAYRHDVFVGQGDPGDPGPPGPSGEIVSMLPAAFLTFFLFFSPLVSNI